MRRDLDKAFRIPADVVELRLKRLKRTGLKAGFKLVIGIVNVRLAGLVWDLPAVPMWRFWPSGPSRGALVEI